ncbi:MAG TPA: PAS domain S-box protein [Candidatus Brocadiia bacterium]|nr:PAS domain S-box protein [Candidatus Brocadiia bacterium]
MRNRVIRILLLEDNPGDARLVRENLLEAGETDFSLRHAATLAEALQLLAREEFDVAICDLALPDATGQESFERIHELKPHLPVVVLTGSSHGGAGVEMVRKGAQDYLAKGDMTPGLLAKTIQYAIERNDMVMMIERLTARELELSRQRATALVQNSSDIITIFDDDGTISYCSPAVTRILGYMPDEIAGTNIYDYVNPEDQQAVQKELEITVKAKGELRSLDVRLRRKSGKWVWCETLAADLRKNPAVGAFIANTRDVTERRQSADQLLHLNRVLMAIRNVNQLIVQERDPERLLRESCRILTCERGYLSAWAAVFDEGDGLKVCGESNLGADFARVIRKSSWREMKCLREALKGSGVIVKDKRNECAGCPLAHVYPETTAMAIRFSAEGGRAGVIVVTVPDGIQANEQEKSLLAEVAMDLGFAMRSIDAERMRAEAEAAVRESEHRFRQIFDYAGDAIVIHDVRGDILEANQHASEILGYSREQLLEMAVQDVIVTEQVGEVERRMREAWERGRVMFESVCIKRDGADAPVEFSSRLIEYRQRPAILTIARDIADRKLLEEELRQALKMEAIGRLAGGVAHDFNNILTAMMGYAQILTRRIDKSDPLHSSAEQILTGAKKAANLTRQLLAFSRKDVIQPRVVDLNETVESMNKMLSRLLSEDIKTSVITTSQPANVKADPGQLEQILINLTLNARDAMLEGGALVIETAFVDIDAESARQRIEMQPGRYVCLSVSDTGCGMDEKTIAHIFEPFFTTKKPGKGTGLGLSTVYGIVKQNNGHITVYSELNEGTTFRLYLPAAAESADPSSSVGEAVPTGSETILVAEDNPAVLSLVSETLKGLGYSLVIASSGEEALTKAAGHSGRIDLFVSDLILPGMTGLDTAVRLQSVRPDLRVLFMTGYSGEIAVQKGIVEPGAPLLQKPFPAEHLARAVRNALDSEPPKLKRRAADY